MKRCEFAFGHLTAGKHRYSVKLSELPEQVRELVDELYESDDGHYMVYFTNTLDESLTVGQTGLMSYSPAGGTKERHHLPASRDRVYEIAIDFLVGHMDWWVGEFGRMPRIGKKHQALFAADRKGTIDFPLHKAAEEGKLAQVKMLVKAGRDVNEVDSDRCTPIVYAAVMGHLAVCRYLVEKGADTSVKSNWGLTLPVLADEYPEVLAYFEQIGVTKPEKH